MSRMLALVVTVAGLGIAPPVAAENVWCHDTERSIVARRARSSCEGEIVTPAEARRIKRQRVERIQRVLEQERNPLVPGRRLGGTGTGFYVSPRGHVLTNHHVVRDCGVVSVTPVERDEQVARVLASDPGRDLALLATDESGVASATFRETTGAYPGEGVNVIGYPLHGRVVIKPLLVSGRLHEESPPPETGVFAMRIDVRRGNSGGPILDSTGQVMGVVVAKVDTPKVYAETGRLIKDVALGIRLALVRTFLSAHDIEPRIASPGAPLDGDALFDVASDFVAQIRCWK